ncbi:hypothetical protein [Sphingomonas sp. S2-65]|uniref:hypothetical protein n=1 Tax=Sphingomonas sp. S2-65 TaxID=2903960 RepID=UPI001F209CE7|nr:hypothetical protein [Sphingomonas sp. S2-65]UYY60183.1 hypothetical protein LZ586_08935 [Sphingomonas sp. S2-65]
MRSAIASSLTLAALFALAGCVAPSEPEPRPAPPVPTPMPAPAPTPRATPSADWRDWPLSPGSWSYRREAGTTVAAFGAPGAASELSLRCDPAAGRITLARRGQAAAPLSATIRTSSTARTVALAPGAAGELTTSLAARDGLIDAMGYSRGRFIVEMAGQPPLVVPAWAEILRIAEDCRS